MKVGDIVVSTRRMGVKNPPAGVILGFSIPFLINRYDEPEYRVLWQSTGTISNTSAKNLRKVS